MVAKVVDVVDILVSDQGPNPDEMSPDGKAPRIPPFVMLRSPGGKSPRSLRLFLDRDLHLH